MRYCFTLFCLCVGCFASLSAQNVADALRHSQTSVTGTARSLGMGGAFSAVGADISAATLNPAGLGLFRKSVFEFTPSFRLINNEADYLGGIESVNRSQFGFTNLGIAFSNVRYTGYGRNRKPAEKGLLNHTFAFGFNQIDNYHRTANASVFNEFSSISDFFAERAQGFRINELGNDPLASMAFNTFVIDTLWDQGGTAYFPAVIDGRVQQSVQLIEKGRQNEWFISLAGNFSNKLFLGATIGIRDIRYENQLILIEEDVNNVHQGFEVNADGTRPVSTGMDRIEFADKFTDEGSGINARIGLIYRPSDALRIGVAVQTPTFSTLTRNFEFGETKLKHTLTEEQRFFLADSLGDALFDYNLTTPFRATVGVMYLIKKSGFLSADIEYTDYTTAKFSSEAPINDPGYYSFQTENQEIQNLLDKAINVRVGGELRLDVVRIRAGAGLHGSVLSEEAKGYLNTPTGSVQQINADRLTLSIGAGIRQPNYFVDVSVTNQRISDKLSPYSLSDTSLFSPTLANTKTSNSVALTLGFYF